MTAAVARMAFRQVRVGALVIGLVFGGSAWATAVAYANAYPTEQARAQAAEAVSASPGLGILLGPVQDIASVGGYLVYKNFVFLALVGGIWAVLAATRVLRGEEDLGRRHLVLAGATTPARATAATLGALAIAVLVIFVGAAGLTRLAARDPALEMGSARTVLYAASLIVVPLAFAAIGALASQLATSRRVATTVSLVVMAVAFALRMAGDARDGWHWVLWTSPFGWTELMRPYTAPDARPLAAAAAFAAALGGATVLLAHRRDVGSGVIAFREAREPRLHLLGSPLGLAVRHEGTVLTVWCLGSLAAGALLGMLTRMTTNDLPESLRTSLERYGARGDFTDQFLGVVFLVVATTVALLPAGQIGAAAAEETSGRLVHLLAGPVQRSTWLAGRLALAAVAILATGLLGGLGVWLGARAAGLTLNLTDLVLAGLNVVPTALVALGVGALVLALAPRAAAASVYVLVVWSVFADLVGPLLSVGPNLTRLSLLHWMALAPAARPSAVVIAVTLVIAGALAATALLLFARRDLRPA